MHHRISRLHRIAFKEQASHRESERHVAHVKKLHRSPLALEIHIDLGETDTLHLLNRR
jgi:predicted RNase H-related nuclease YkuK (DUF458 family)